MPEFEKPSKSSPSPTTQSPQRLQGLPKDWLTPTPDPLSPSITRDAAAKVISEGEAPILAWLNMHMGKNRNRSAQELLAMIRKEVPSAAQKTNEEIFNVIRKWSIANKVYFATPLPLNPNKPLPPSKNKLEVEASEKAEAGVKKGKPFEGPKIGAEVEVSYELNGKRVVLPGITVKISTGIEGLEGVETEVKLIKTKLPNLGVARNVKVTIKAVGLTEIEKNSIKKFGAKLKGSINADLKLPFNIAIPVEVSVFMDEKGKPGAGAEITIFSW